jgi:hypothetical protein
MRSKSAEERYRRLLQKQQDMLDGFVEEERTAAELLLYLFKKRGRDMPDDMYRAVCFFTNNEYKAKQKALVLLYETGRRLDKETGTVAKERAADLLCYRYQVYGAALLQGGY